MCFEGYGTVLWIMIHRCFPKLSFCDLGHFSNYLPWECAVHEIIMAGTHKFLFLDLFTFHYTFPFPQILMYYFSSLPFLPTFLPLLISILSLLFLRQNDTISHSVLTVDAVCPTHPSWIKELTLPAEGYWLLMAHNSVPFPKLSSAEGSYLAQDYAPP